MKCRYCKTEINLMTWFSFSGKCYFCNEKINEPQMNKRLAEFEIQQKDSNKYWEDKK